MDKWRREYRAQMLQEARLCRLDGSEVDGDSRDLFWGKVNTIEGLSKVVLLIKVAFILTLTLVLEYAGYLVIWPSARQKVIIQLFETCKASLFTFKYNDEFGGRAYRI
jgi:hypothetical protein